MPFLNTQFYMDSITQDAKLLELFSVKKLHDEQKTVIRHILESKEDLIAIMATGCGKTLCFMIASYILKGKTVIVYPLLSLINDQKKRFDSSPIKAFTLIGGQTKQQRKEIFEQLDAIESAVILTNPETLLSSNTLDELKRYRISLFVLDEAHTVIEWGETFREAFLKLSEAVKKLAPYKVLSFTATLSPEGAEKLKTYIYSNRAVSVIRFSSDRKNITYKACPSLSRQKTIMDILLYAKRPAVVFTHTRKDAEKYALYIREHTGFKTLYYHAGCSKKHKKLTEEEFYKSSDAILCATSAYGMGVDKKNIRSVIHVYPPPKISEYIQEAGRAGRDGEKATSYVIVKKQDVLCASETAKIFYEQKECIRKSLLKSMGEDLKDLKCDCSVCLNEKPSPEGQDELLKLIKAYNGYFTLKSLVRFLKEKNMSIERLLYNNHSFKYWGETSLKDAIETLIQNNDATLIGNHIYISPLKRFEQFRKRLYNNIYDFKQKYISKLVRKKCFNKQR